GTLLLPRDDRVLRGAKPEDILGALAGVTLGPADLAAILTGCVVPAPQAMDGRRHANGWASIDLAGGATLFLQPAPGGLGAGSAAGGVANRISSVERRLSPVGATSIRSNHGDGRRDGRPVANRNQQRPGGSCLHGECPARCGADHA